MIHAISHPKNSKRIFDTHIEEHGHKRLRIFCVMFVLVLIYPYFSNAQENIDSQVCENQANNYPECDICPDGFVLDDENNCIQDDTGDPIDDEEEEEEENVICETTISSPGTGDIYSGHITMSRSVNSGCDEDTQIDIQLRDHNNQWIQLGTGTLGQTSFDFITTGLAQTGFYHITGLYMSGDTREVIEDDVIIDSGVYMQDTPYYLFTGSYTGNYSDYATGYLWRLVDGSGNVLAENPGAFVIDNAYPIVDQMTIELNNVISGSVGKRSTATIGLQTNEATTGVSFTILGTNLQATQTTQSGNLMVYTIAMENVVATGPIVLTAHVADLAGNAVTLYGTSAIVFNNHIPQISNLALTGGSGSIGMTWNTDTASRYVLHYTQSGSDTTTYFTGTVYATAHNYTMTNIQKDKIYGFGLTVTDILGNYRTLSGNIIVGATGGLTMQLQEANSNILQLPQQAETDLYLEILQREIDKFRVCKQGLSFTQQTIPVGSKTLTIQIPVLQKVGVRQSMITFLLLFSNKIKHRTELSQLQLDQVANSLNNFLVVIKLSDDDDGVCDQKVSNYYMSRFEQMMTQMNFF